MQYQLALNVTLPLEFLNILGGVHPEKCQFSADASGGE
jgi:hypothetical protein